MCPANHAPDEQGSGHAVQVSIIIPTYNESENVPLLLWLLHEQLNEFQPRQLRCSEAPGTGWWEVIVVDDGSPDGTAGVVQGLQQDPLLGHNLRLVQRPGKQGLGTAYLAGMAQARGEWVVLMDADLSHHPKYIPAFFDRQAATGCDVVCGTRYARGGGVAGWGLMRKLTSRGANLLASTLLGARVSDLTGSFRLYRRDCLVQLLSQSTCKGYAFQMEVVVRAQAAGLALAEEPIVFVDRLYGTSKLGPHEFLGFLSGLIRLAWAL